MTTKKQILQAIRKHCIDCSGGSKEEVKLCTVSNCEQYPFRMGKDPMPARKAPKIVAKGEKLREDNVIELRRAPGTCCPEPGCDYGDFDFRVCPNCGADCKKCRFYKEGKKK